MAVGDDSIVGADIELCEGAKLGSNVTLLSQGRIGFDAVIEDHVRIGSTRSDSAQISNGARIGARCNLEGAEHLRIKRDATLKQGVIAMGPVQIGEDAVVDENVFIRNAKVGTQRHVPAGVRINGYCPEQIDHGDNEAAGRIDPSATVEPGVLMGANVQVGAGSTIRKGAVIGEGVDIREDVVIGRQALVEKGAVLLNGTRVPEGEQVRAGAIRSGYSGAQRHTRAEDGLPGVHVTARLDRTAHIHPSAKIGAGAKIRANTTIGPDCDIGENTGVGASTLGAGVKIGSNCVVWAATLEDGAQVGNRCQVTAAYVGPGATSGRAPGKKCAMSRATTQGPTAAGRSCSGRTERALRRHWRRPASSSERAHRFRATAS